MGQGVAVFRRVRRSAIPDAPAGRVGPCEVRLAARPRRRSGDRRGHWPALAAGSPGRPVRSRGRAAGLGDLARIHEMDEGLHDGVIGRIRVGRERKVALPAVEEGWIAVLRDDLVLKSKNMQIS